MALTFIPFQFSGLPHVHCAFQTRTGGASSGPCGGGNISWRAQDVYENVLQNRRDICPTLGLRHFAEVHQVQKDAFIFDPKPLAPEDDALIEADGMATTQRGLGLCIKTADCQPILIAHSGGQHIAALHIGWRGNRQSFIGSYIQRFCEAYKLLPKDLLAVRGPSLGPRAAQFINFDQEWGADFAQYFSAKEQTMDLWSLTRSQLQQAGLKSAHIFGLDMCTFSMNDVFFSHRRHAQAGRQISVIWLS